MKSKCMDSRMAHTGNRGFRQLCAFLVFGLPMLSAVTAGGEDEVKWSDGRRWEGCVRLAGGDTVQVQDERTLRRIPLSEVSAIEWQVATQRMERAWHFVEAGRTEKTEQGDPFPVRYWTVRIQLRNGATLDGNLITAAFYLENPEGTLKLLVRRKQRGMPGQRFEDLVSPVHMRFARRDAPEPDEVAVPTPVETRMRFQPPIPGAQAAAVSLDPLAAVMVDALDDGAFRLFLPGSRMIVALRDGNRIHVGWVDHGPPAMRSRLETATREVTDFFDERRLLGFMADPEQPDRAFSLMLLLRRGAVTFTDSRPFPWRLEIWHWRLGDADTILLEARAVVFRDRRAAEDPDPEIIPVGAWLRAGFHESDIVFVVP